MGMKFTNNATSTLATGITNVATSLTVATGQGALFPTLGAGDYFYCTLANLAGSVEIIKVTARTGDSFGTIVRAQDGTSALAWNAGDKVELRLVAASLNDIPKLDENNTFTGTNTVVTQTAGDNSTNIASTAFTQAAIAAAGFPSLTVTVAGNALTGTLVAPSSLQFRSPTLTTGAPVSTFIPSNLILTVPSGATLGTTNAVQARLIFLVAYNAGSPVLCVTNLAGGLQLDETNLVSPTTISAAATAANVIYSAAPVAANSPYRIVGACDITEATAGTYATGPTLVQGAGGESLAAMASLGYGQTWQNVAGSRVLGTTYYNTKGKPITVMIGCNTPSGSTLTFSENGANLCQVNAATGTGVLLPLVAVVPPGFSYSLAVTGGSGSIGSWFELY